MSKKFISKKFIHEISSVISCGACFFVLKDPVECSECQHEWCSKCIEQNHNKCPNRCKSPKFIKPHRFFRKLLEEIVFECSNCKTPVKYSSYHTHFQEEDQCFKMKSDSQNKRKSENTFTPSPEKRICINDENVKKSDIMTKQKPQICLNIFSDDDWTESYENITKENSKSNSKQNNIISVQSDSEQSNINSHFIDEIFQDNIPCVKLEKFNKNSCKVEDQSNLQGFTRLNLVIYNEGKWEELSSELNLELNMKLLELLSKRNGKNNQFNELHNFEDLQLKTKNTVFDFGRLEMHEAFSYVKVSANEEEETSDKLFKKNKKRFLPFSSKKLQKKHLLLYVEVEKDDKIFFEKQDNKKVLEQLNEDPSNCNNIITSRSKVNINTMKEFNGTKSRNVKFLLTFPSLNQDQNDY